MNDSIIVFAAFALLGMAVIGIATSTSDPIESAPIEYSDQELATCACDIARLGYATALSPEVRCSGDHGLVAPHVQRERRLWRLCRNGTPSARAIHEAEEAERDAMRVELDAELQRLRERVAARRRAQDATNTTSP